MDDSSDWMLRDEPPKATAKRTDVRWRAYQFSIQVVRLVNDSSLPKVNASILDQLLRSATSVGANLVEAKSASSKRDFAKYHDIALKSANETKYWLCLLRDALGIPRDRIQPLLQEAEELSNIIAASLLTMRNKR